ncbi:MAG TPA: SDR family oxidoreductase [Chloroflexota bacterium]|nr:SDR family oxidoreductase [Chloroflexota bacterium]
MRRSLASRLAGVPHRGRSGLLRCDRGGVGDVPDERAGLALLVVAGRRPAPLQETVKLIEGQGGQACAVTADVSSATDVAGLVESTVARYGRLDAAFNNAGILGRPGPLVELDEATWSAVLAANLTGVWLSMKYEIAHMRTHGGGVIVNMASNVGAHLTVPGLAAYAAAKAAVSTLTRTAALEYIRHGIRINAVSPGPVAAPISRLPGGTDAERDARIGPQLPIGRVGGAEEIAAAVLWLASPASSFVVGHDLVIDGGASA